MSAGQPAAAGARLNVSSVAVRFGGFQALRGIDMHVEPGERLGIIGPNGSGKSTLVNCISGTVVPSGGSVLLDGQDLAGLPPHRRSWRGISRTFQLPRPFRSLSVRENVHVPLMHQPQGSLSDEEIEARAAAALSQVGLAAKAGEMPSRLTQVELRKLELAKCMAARPRLLIADEAMAGLASSEVDEILDLLLAINATGTSIIMIEHIMRAVTRFSQRLAVIVAGEKIADGLPREVLALPEVERAYLGQ